MPMKHLFALLLMFAVVSGCTLARQAPPNIAVAPPYLQSRTQQERSQLAEMRAFHAGESARISEEMHIVRNRDMERLEATGRELKQDERERASHEKVPAQRERWTWANLFKKKDQGNNDKSPLVSQTDETNKNLR